MILTFSKPQFKDKILTEVKIHTIRKDVNNRWLAGKKIHFWMHNPRNVSKYPFRFGIGVCKSTQKIEIERNVDPINGAIIKIDGRELNQDEIKKLALNDGFDDMYSFWMWFKDGLTGKIIHWTNYKY